MAHPETAFYNGRGRFHCLLLVAALLMALPPVALGAAMVWAWANWFQIILKIFT